MNQLIDLIEGDRKKRVTLDNDDVRKFRALYWDGVDIIEFWEKEMREGIGNLEMPTMYTIAYYLEEELKTVGEGKQQQQQKVWMMETDAGRKEVPTDYEFWSAKPMMGFYFLTPLNPVRSTKGVLVKFYMIRRSVLFREGWGGYDKLQIIKNAEFFIQKWDPVKNAVVETPIDIDFNRDDSEIVSSLWHNKVSSMMWREMSKVNARINDTVSDYLEQQGVDLTELEKEIEGIGSWEFVEGMGGKPVNKEGGDGKGGSGDQG